MFPPNLIRAYSKNPNKWVRDVLHATPKPWQDKVLEDLGRGIKPISVRSGAGVGKTALESWAILWFLSTKPFPKVPCTAPTEHHLFDVLWAECSRWMRESPVLQEHLQWTQTKIFMKAYPEEWFAIARTCKSNKDGFVSEGLQGFHAEHMLFVVDEASGMDDQALAAIDGIVATGHAHILMCGNPVRLTGMFYDSHNKYPELFHTHHINCLHDPGIKEAYIKLMEAKYGRGSAMWLSKVEGEFPNEDSYVLFDPRKVDRIYNPNTSVPEVPVTIGVDVADGGNCESVFIVRRSDVIIDIVAKRGLDTEKNADVIRRLAQQYAPYRKILVDAVGPGGGVVSSLRRRKMRAVYPVKGSWDASDPKMYFNHRSESYSHIAMLVRDGSLRSLKSCDQLKKNLLMHKQEPNEDGIFQVTPKVKMLRKGDDSPDYSDALAVSYGHELSKPRTEVTSRNFLEINRTLNKTALFKAQGGYSGRRSSRFDYQR